MHSRLDEKKILKIQTFDEPDPFCIIICQNIALQKSWVSFPWENQVRQAWSFSSLLMTVSKNLFRPELFV